MLIKAGPAKETPRAELKYPGLEIQPDQGKNRGWLHQMISRFLRKQFGRPTGLWGGLAGKIMALTPSNQQRIQWTISLLKARPEDRVLEIGFGSGLAIASMSKIVSKGFVAGIDHSEVMVRQAAKRNREAIREGRVMLKLGSVASLPEFDEPFDKIFTINSIHFWNEPINCLRELGKLLKPGGLIAITLQPRSRSATHATTAEVGKEIALNLEQAGYTQIRLEIKQIKPVSVACALGIKSR